MKELNFGIIGCGRIGKRHAGHANNYGRLVAVCDIHNETAKAVSKEYNARSYTRIEEFLQKEKGNIDVIAICTPNGMHYEHTLLCLNAGYHVICEKPMALDKIQAGEMIQCAEENNKRLFVVKQNRFNPPVKELKKLLDQDVLGEIYSVQLNCFWNRNFDYYENSWKGTKDLDGGTLFTQFSHFIDLLIWMFGEIKTAKGFSENKHHQNIIEFEDCGVIALKFRNGILGSIHYTVNSYEKNMEGSITLFAKNGTLKIGGQYLNELEYQLIKNYDDIKLPEGNAPNNYGNYVGSMSNHNEIYKNVVEVLQTNGKISTSGYEGLKTIEAIQLIYEAIR